MPLPRPHAAPVAPLAALLLAACATPGSGPQLSAAQPGTLAACEALAGSFATPGLVITAASRVAADALKVGGQPVGAHCLVSGKLNERTSPVDAQTYAIRFEMRLPERWSGRYLYQANGGLDGNVVPAQGGFGGGPLTNALQQGFAVISSDAGHQASQHPFFGLDPQARLDYGYQAVGKLTPLAKGLIRAAYGRGPDRSYFAGCSNGGRHAFVAMSRYASEYDGFLAGAPGWQLPKAAVANMWGAQRYLTVASNPADITTAFTQPERQLLSRSVLARCDALDGAADGIVADSRACQAAFSIERDVPSCSGARDGSCLTPAQKAVVSGIFKGATTSDGKAFYSSFPWDAGHGTAGVAFWEFTASMNLDPGAVGFVMGTPPEKREGFNAQAFTRGASIDDLVKRITATAGPYAESGMGFMSPPNPGDLGAVQARGGKVLVYHGVSDAIFSSDDTLAWLAAARARHGASTDSLVRYFPVPGMGHCSGGPSTDQVDFLSPLVAWVEQGRAPDRITAGARGPGNAGGANADLPAGWSPTRTRPLCPAPLVARYKGSGSLEEATSFECKP
jgi:hypothetical protein